MSTYSIEVSGPSAKLAMLRALANKMLGRLSNIAAVVKVTLTRTARVAKAATTTGLALVGSPAGYQLVRHGVRALVTGAVRLTGSGLRMVSRGLGAVGRVLHDHAVQHDLRTVVPVPFVHPPVERRLGLELGPCDRVVLAEVRLYRRDDTGVAPVSRRQLVGVP